jgi:hypothetical protein
MMRKTIKPQTGDVRVIHIYPNNHGVRIAIHDDDTETPLIQASLTNGERAALRKALED